MENEQKQKEILLNILKWFHNFCEEKGLRYYMVYGTMLGAVRHKGFIPWDDDIDVGMPREDYEKFMTYQDQIFNDRYIIETPYSKDKGYTCLWSKVYDTQTTLVEYKRKPIKRGLYIDVFPLDGFGNTEEEALHKAEVCKKKVKIYLTQVCAMDKGRVWWKNLAILLGRCLYIFKNTRKERIKLEKSIAEYDFDTSKYVGYVGDISGMKNSWSYEIYGTPTLYEFEDAKFYGVSDYDGYLARLYGDYMTPPPEDKRISRHLYKEINLEKSFLETGK